MSSLTIAIGPGLLDSLKVGSLQLPNRVIMAPLTRCRASEGRVPNVLMAEYYRQRASAGLIISEATAVTPMGVGYPDTPGIWSDEQVEGWQLVTEAVHSEGGRMMLQLWHVGRISDPAHLHGKLPVAPSTIAPEGHVNLLRPKKNYGKRTASQSPPMIMWCNSSIPVALPFSVSVNLSTPAFGRVPACVKLFQGIFIANDGFSQKTAEEVLARGEADAVAFGRPFIANPDLPRRFALGVQLNVPDPKTFYATLRDVGYTDYPTLRTIGG